VDLTEAARDNARKLIALGARVRTGVDGTKLADTFSRERFRTVIFQFPNVSSREAHYGQNPNHVMVTRFLKSARDYLSPDGEIVISTVDSPFYEGAFKMLDAAEKAGLAAPRICDFDPSRFPGYMHQNTENEDSALENHVSFATFVFSKPVP
jgi:25S rRNA (uracil2634-N3)-methyltransferase